MIHKLKSISFSGIARIYKFLSGRGMGKIPGMLAFYDLLFRIFWPKENILEIQGSKMYLNVRYKDPDIRKTFQAYALNRIHEKTTTELFNKVVKEGDVVADIGANIGYFTLLSAKIVGKNGKVYSFEPEPRNFGFLKKNIELNDYTWVTANQKAVAEEPGTVKLYLCPYDTGHHTINQYGGIKAYKPEFIDNKKDFVEVEKVALDAFFEGVKQPIDVIKMDVEGAELLALSGMYRIIRESEDLKMFVEFFPLLIKEMGDSPEEFIRRLLEDYHFSMFVISDDYSMGDYTSNEGYSKINSIDELMKFCRGELDHVNLFLIKGKDKDKYVKELFRRPSGNDRN